MKDNDTSTMDLVVRWLNENDPLRRICRDSQFTLLRFAVYPYVLLTGILLCVFIFFEGLVGMAAMVADHMWKRRQLRRLRRTVNARYQERQNVTEPTSSRSRQPINVEFLLYLFLDFQNCDALVGD